MTVKDLIAMLICGADRIIGAEQELTDIDSRFGDADHGITMTKVMNNVKKALGECGDDATIKSVLDDASMAVMSINGGSAVPLWSTLFEGMCDGAVDAKEVDEAGLKVIFKMGYEVLFALSKAKVGDKTMMDALIPAVEAINVVNGSVAEIMAAGAKAACQGAEDSRNFVSKFGRAKSYKEQTIGTPDAGAMSMQYFFVGMSEWANQ